MGKDLVVGTRRYLKKIKKINGCLDQKKGISKMQFHTLAFMNRKKSKLLPSAYVQIAPKTNVWSGLLSLTILVNPIYPLTRFVFFISLHTS
jgi:hypothetical protein